MRSQIALVFVLFASPSQNWPGCEGVTITRDTLPFSRPGKSRTVKETTLDDYNWTVLLHATAFWSMCCAYTWLNRTFSRASTLLHQTFVHGAVRIVVVIIRCFRKTKPVSPDQSVLWVLTGWFVYWSQRTSWHKIQQNKVSKSCRAWQTSATMTNIENPRITQQMHLVTLPNLPQVN